MQEGKRISNGEFYGESMESQSREKAVSALFFTLCKQKNQQLHFCKLLISRAENETRTRDPNLGKVVLYQLSYFRNMFSSCEKAFTPPLGIRNSRFGIANIN